MVTRRIADNGRLELDFAAGIDLIRGNHAENCGRAGRSFGLNHML